MYLYAGIDEAGYGPMFGPLLVGRAVLAIEGLSPDPLGSDTPSMWQRLAKAVCRSVRDRKGRIAVNDSKKLYSPSQGLAHLERSVLAFAALAGHQPAQLDRWLACLGESAHHDLRHLPWYAADADDPWTALPCSVTAGELAVARGMLSSTCHRVGVALVDLGAAVVFEDRFNRMVSATRSKAAASFTFVARHLDAVWQRFGTEHPVVIVDRQSGRMRYRPLLAEVFPTARLAVLDESPLRSSYRLEEGPRRMVVRFEVDADAAHMPVSLASMIAKYTRELLMARFQAWFSRRAPQVKPTAGYAADAKRFWHEIEPMLPDLGVAPDHLRRLA